MTSRGGKGVQMSPPAAGDAAASSRRVRDETGASLILALLFLVVIGTVVGGIASWTSNALGNTIVFQNAAKAQSALSSATNTAIQLIRYTPLIGDSTGATQTLNANPPSYCFGPTSPGESQVTPTLGYQVDVWCSTVWNPTSAATRVVTVSACLSSNDEPGNVTPAQFAATCAKNPGLQTVVTFDDYSAENANLSQVACTSPPHGNCGSGMTISSSLIGVGSPSVSLIQTSSGPPQSGPATGGGTLTLTGTGFVAGPSGCGSSPSAAPCSTAVNFVDTNAAKNIVLSGANVTVASPTSLTVTIPPATTVTTYNVVVTTPNGTSPTGGSATVYTYNPVTPTVTSATTASGTATGSAAGGSTIIITGAGFVSSNGGSTTVEFVDQGPGGVNPTAPSGSVNVNATGTQLTATTPAISSTDLSYSVVVVTAPGGQSNLASAPTFTYSPLLPLVASASGPNGTSGAPGTQVTVTGVGFISNANSNNTSVQLVPTSGNSPTLNVAATAVTVTGSTSLTFAVPTGGTLNRAYYVEVTTPSGSSGSSGAPQFTWT
jgi:hypothetical protein